MKKTNIFILLLNLFLVLQMTTVVSAEGFRDTKSDDHKEIKTEYVTSDLFSEIQGGKDNYEADEEIVRKAYWNGEYNGELIMTPNGHLVSFDKEGRIYIDNYSFGFRNMHYNPDNYSRDYMGNDIYSDEDGAWILMQHWKYKVVPVEDLYSLTYWQKGECVKEFKSKDLVLLNEQEIEELDGYFVTFDFNCQKLGNYMFENYGKRSAVINLETGEVTRLADDIIDVQIENDSVKYVCEDHKVYQITTLNPLDPIVVDEDVVKFEEEQAKPAEISEDELRIYRAVQEVYDWDYDGRFESLSEITHLDEDANTYVSVEGALNQLVINNRETGLYINRCNIAYKYTKGANLFTSNDHKYAFLAEDGKLHMCIGNREKLFEIPNSRGYQIVKAHENTLNNNGKDIISYYVVLEVYNDDKTSDAYMIKVSADGDEFSIKEIAKNVRDMRYALSYNSIMEDVAGYSFVQNYNDYTDYLYYLDNNNTIYLVDINSPTFNPEKIKDNALALMLDT